MNKTLPFILLSLVLTACGAQPAPAASPQSAILSEVLGIVNAKQAGETDFTPAADGLVLNENGQVQTGDDGKARLDLSGGTIVRVAPSSLFTLVSNNPESGSQSTQIQMDAGKLWIILNGGELEVEAPSGQASVRGSRMGVASDADRLLRITCLEGTCTFHNETGDYIIPPGSVLTCTGQNDVPTIESMSPADVTEWIEIDGGVTAFLPALTAAAATATEESTPTPTPTPVPPTPTPSPLPTFSVLGGEVTADSLSCRYGPGANYLFEYGLTQGNEVQVLGRADTAFGTWVLVKFGTTLKPCWVNSRFIALSGDVSALEPVYPEKAPLILFQHANFPPPADVNATRNGDEVTINWTGYELAPGDRESEDSPLYLVETWTCQAGMTVFTPLGAFEESARVKDEAGCSEPSHGHVYLAHKDGYVGPTEIPWP